MEQRCMTVYMRQAVLVQRLVAQAIVSGWWFGNYHASGRGGGHRKTRLMDLCMQVTTGPSRNEDRLVWLMILEAPAFVEEMFP